MNAHPEGFAGKASLRIANARALRDIVSAIAPSDAKWEGDGLTPRWVRPALVWPRYRDRSLAPVHSVD